KRLPDYGCWPEPVPELVAAASGDVLRDDVYVLPPLETYVNGAVVLVGDAAHAMSPDLGQAAAQGLEDAVALGRRAFDLPSYDRLRRARTQHIARASRRLGRTAQSASPPAVRLRNAAIRLAPRKLLFRIFAPVIDHEP